MAKIDVRPLSEYEIREPMMGKASPLLLFGILLFVIPYFEHLIKLPFPGLIRGVGIFFMVAGIIHSGAKMMASKQDKYQY